MENQKPFSDQRRKLREQWNSENEKTGISWEQFLLNKVEPKKLYYQRDNIGKAKYCVFNHDGVKTHKDGSSFYDIAIFSNKKKVSAYIKDLIKEGYVNKY